MRSFKLKIMKISTEWLNNLVDLNGISNKTLADALIMSGTNVEKIENNSGLLKNIVIGKIISIEKHKNADSLFVCKVDIKTKTIQIITSATNIKVNALIPVCLDGGMTANGLKIKKGKLRGEISEGMMCSIGEVGLSKNDYPYAIIDGIFLIEEPCEIGQDFCEAFNLNTTTFEFEITSNRPDCLSAIGIANEICAVFERGSKFKTPINYCTQINSNDYFNVEIKTANCLRYMAKVVQNVKIGSSPLWLKKRLQSCDIQSINNVVDVTNYVMMELGVPMHAFDLNKLEGNKIVVRQANSNEQLQTLMHTTVDLNETDLVVCDGNKPVAIAGIIGGTDSSVDENTSNILLEVGCFNEDCIRKTSNRLLIKTQASLRFEKGLNPKCCEQTLNRVCELIEMLQIGTISSTTTDMINFKDENYDVQIKLDCDKINSLIGFNLSDEQIIKILDRLNLKTTDGFVKIPPNRVDLKNSADLAEEVARIYGYDKIKSVAVTSKTSVQFNETWAFENKLRNILTSVGCSEIYSYSFSNIIEMNKANLNFNQSEIVEIANPFGEETRYLKTSTIPAMLNSLIINHKNKQKQAWLFEIGKTYCFKNGKPLEEKQLTIGLLDSNCNFFTIKGIVNTILTQLKIFDYLVKPVNQMPFHDYAACEIFYNDLKIGILGEVHPTVCENFKFNNKVFIAVLNFEILKKMLKKEIIFKPISKFPESGFDLTFICDNDLSCFELETQIKKSAGEFFKSCSVESVYKDAKLGDNLKSVSFKIILQSHDRTLTKLEIDTAMKNIIENLSKIGANLRS